MSSIAKTVLLGIVWLNHRLCQPEVKIRSWARKNPDGWIIFYSDSPHRPMDAPAFSQPYRSGSIVVRPASSQIH
jgi:hypothetical protein